MRKDKNTGLTITISKKDLEMLDFLAQAYECSKTDIIKKCLKTSSNIRKMFNDLDYNELNTSNKKYYVKCICENFGLCDNRPLSLKKLDKNGLIAINNEIGYKSKNYMPNNGQDIAKESLKVDWLHL